MSTSTMTEYSIEEHLDTTVCIMMFSWLRNAYVHTVVLTGMHVGDVNGRDGSGCTVRA